MNIFTKVYVILQSVELTLMRWKTHICLSATGAEGEAVYIDTEGSFIIERVTQMAQAAVQQIQVRVRHIRDIEAQRNLFFCKYATETCARVSSCGYRDRHEFFENSRI
jgi:hypothetical protein